MSERIPDDIARKLDAMLEGSRQTTRAIFGSAEEQHARLEALIEALAPESPLVRSD